MSNLALTLAQVTDAETLSRETIVESLRSMGATFLALLPKVGLALVVVVFGWWVANRMRARLEPRLRAVRTPSFGRVFSTLIAAAVKTLALLAGLVIAFPSVDVVTIVGGLGVLGIAAGFAFQDILSNLLAGILLIFRQPFVSGDQIEVTGITGTVEEITIRETRLLTFGGRLVVVPNKDVYVNAIEVQTAYDHVRSSFVTGVGYDSDLDDVRRVTHEALAEIDDVLEEPAPEAYFIEHGASAVILDVRYWTAPQQAVIRRAQDQVAQALYDAFARADIDIPFDIVTLESGAGFAKALEAAGRSSDAADG